MSVGEVVVVGWWWGDFYGVFSDVVPLEQHQEQRFLSRGFLPGQWTAQNCLSWTSAKPAVCPTQLGFVLVALACGGAADDVTFGSSGCPAQIY